MKDVFNCKKRINESKPRCHRETFLEPVTFFFKICQSFKFGDDFRVRWSQGSSKCLQKQQNCMNETDCFYREVIKITLQNKVSQ